jgi:hypothetical protein
MIMDFVHEHKLDSSNIGDAIFKLHDQIDHLQAQIYDRQNQNSGGQAHYFITTIIEEGNMSTRVWAPPLACSKLGGGSPVSYHHHFYHHYLS